MAWLKQTGIEEAFSHGASTPHLGNWKLGNWGIHFFPLWLRTDSGTKANLKQARYVGEETAQHYLERLGLEVEDLFYHVLATLHDPAYRVANAGALHMGWPRIPLPGWPAPGSAGALPATEAAEALGRSAARGRRLAALLDPGTSVAGVTTGILRPEIAAIAVPATTRGDNMSGDDFGVTAGWGHFGTGDAVMPGQGRVIKRPYTADERAALGDTTAALGSATFDVYLNDRAFWRNIPAAVWGYRLGGYQVLKKWLSYRERDVLGRALSPQEVLYFAEIARRIGKILQIHDYY
ncbi:MAG: hypothetical protein OXP66_14165 [Candidatus Tectomicrobia bacterium]|nr:hypothetical protein [Candidatus Tectomicrobia bacterium]